MTSSKSARSRAWVVGGGILQEPLVLEFKKRGLHVIVSDRDEKCVCRDLADTFYRISTQDLTYHEVFRDPELAGVMTAGTDAGPQVSLIAEINGLPATSYASALVTKNKRLFRSATNFDHPWWGLRPKAFPCVAKPTMLSASRGVSLIPDADEYERRWAEVSGDVLYEEYLGGKTDAPQACFDWFLVDGELFFVNGVERFFHPEHFGLEVGYVNPFRAPWEVTRLAYQSAKACGVRNGPFKTDMIYDERYGWCILEAATRWSGGLDHNRAAFWTTGRDLTAVLADYALGLGFHISSTRFQVGRYVAQWNPCLALGTVVTDALLDDIRKQPEVLDVVKIREKQDAYSQAGRPVWIFAEGRTREEAISKARSVAERYERR